MVDNGVVHAIVVQIFNFFNHTFRFINQKVFTFDVLT